MATGRTHGVADHAVGVVGAIEPRRIRLDEGLEERERGWGILGQQLARHLVQPAVEHAAELARLAVAVELGRAPPAGQRLLEAGGELVRPIGQLHAREACLNGLVVLGEFEQHGDQVPRVLTAEEGLQVFVGWFRHGVRGLAVQLDGVPWLKSQNVPCQFEIRPSVPQARQRQTTTSMAPFTGTVSGFVAALRTADELVGSVRHFYECLENIGRRFSHQEIREVISRFGSGHRLQ